MSNDLGPELDKLALGILKDVASLEIDRRIDALKAITTLYLGQARINGKVQDDSPQDTGLPAMRRRIEVAASGGK